VCKAHVAPKWLRLRIFHNEADTIGVRVDFTPHTVTPYPYTLLDDKFTPTKHLTPPPTTAASPQRLTPTRRHPCCTKKKGRARRRTAPTDLAHSWATQARPRRRAWARGTPKARGRWFQPVHTALKQSWTDPIPRVNPTVSTPFSSVSVN